MSADILGTSWDQCRSMVQYNFTSTETRRLVRTDSPGRPPRLSQLLNYDYVFFFLLDEGRTEHVTHSQTHTHTPWHTHAPSRSVSLSLSHRHTYTHTRELTWWSLNSGITLDCVCTKSHVEQPRWSVLQDWPQWGGLNLGMTLHHCKDVQE